MSAPDWLAGLLEQVRTEAAAAATAATRAELLRARQATTSGPRLLSLAALGKRYGIGRKQAEALIAAGRLPSVERRARGGRLGTFVCIEDAEVVLAGEGAPVTTVPSRAVVATHAELADHWRTQAALARHDGRRPGLTDELRARLRLRAELWAARAAALELRMRASRGRR